MRKIENLTWLIMAGLVSVATMVIVIARLWPEG